MWIISGIKLVTVAEFAKLVGVSRTAVYKWIKKGLPACISGNRYLIFYDDALKWLKGGGRRS